MRHISVSLAIILCIFATAGCVSEYNLATRQEEMIYYSTDKEVRMGEALDREVEKKYKSADDPLIQNRVEAIGRKIAAVCERKDIDYHFRVLKDDEINAFSLPGGFIYVNSGLVDKVSGDDELAGVLAHEIGHVVARHSIKKLQAVMGYSLLRILLAQAPAGGDVGYGADAAFMQILLGYSREDELLADQLAARYANLAGFNPEGIISFLNRLQETERNKPLKPLSYGKTHPYIPDRIRVVKQELGERISFDDYINIEQLPHQN